jgi:hypothetical protein
MRKKQDEHLARFGLSFEKGGAHTSRTMMVQELTLLLSYVDNPKADKKEYLRAIEEDNCLGKRSGKTRKLTARHLAELYTLDPNVTVFRALLYFWKRDHKGRSMLSLLCSYARDGILRLSMPFIMSFMEGQIVSREALEGFIDKLEPGRFSKATLRSTAQNINSTWTKSGHLVGRVKKVRSKGKTTPGAVSYALLLGYLNGVRGSSLFSTDYAKLLDCSTERSIELAEDASRRGWIVFKRVEAVIEVLFPNILTPQEMEWIREQN